jgi:iron complex transport system substrate-binding protein
MRIVSICPSNTEMLAYLGLSSSIVGIDDYSDWPPFPAHVPRLGPDLDINMDEVERLKPDLVIASLSVPGMERNIEQLKKRNLPYLILNPNSVTEIGNDILLLGEATDTYHSARRVYEKYNEILEQFREFSRQVPYRPSLYWEWWAKPVFTPGGLNWLTEISRLAGGWNLYEDVEKASVQTDWEDVRSRNPEYILLAWVGIRPHLVKPELVLKRPFWDKLKAVKSGRIYILEEHLYCRPSVRLIFGLKKLAHLLYPDLYPPYDENEENSKELL